MDVGCGPLDRPREGGRYRRSIGAIEAAIAATDARLAAMSVASFSGEMILPVSSQRDNRSSEAANVRMTLGFVTAAVETNTHRFAVETHHEALYSACKRPCSRRLSRRSMGYSARRATMRY